MFSTLPLEESLLTVATFYSSRVDFYVGYKVCFRGGNAFGFIVTFDGSFSKVDWLSEFICLSFTSV